MSTENPPHPDPARTTMRRAQILAAAARCFGTHGFHGASVAELAKAAGMSVGHIYHYFENKEAIIAGIVAQDLERVMASTAKLKSDPDPLAAMMASIADHLVAALDPHRSGLVLEITVEASRNERVADIVRAADASGMAALRDILRDIRRGRGHDDTDAAIVSMAEIIAALVEGLMVRSIRNPGLDRKAAIDLIGRVVVFLAGNR